MIHSLSESIVDFLLCQKAILDDDKQIYVYGVELIVSSLINMLICLIIGFITRQIVNVLLLFLSFVSLRLYLSGYHCKTYLKCNITFGTVIFIILYINNVIGNNKIFIFILIIFNILIVLLLTKNGKHKLYIQEKKYKIVSVIILILHTTIYFLTNNTSVIIITDFIVILSMLYKIFLERSDKNVDKEINS